MRRLGSWLSDVITLDLRSLALFRIFLGVFVLCDLGVRFSDLEMFYTDDGVLSSQYISRMNWSIHAWSGSVFWQYVLFALSAIFAFMLLLGFQTKLATVMTYLLNVSLQLRNPALNNAGDILLANILFISIFLPLSSCFVWSLGKNIKKKTERFDFSSPWVLIYFIQLVLLYVFSGYSKYNQTWNGDGLGVYYALNLMSYAKGNASCLLNYPKFLWVLNYLILFLERFLWLLLFLPKKYSWVRIILVISFIMFHLGLFMFMELGMFPWLGIVIWISVLPSSFWKLFDKSSFSLVLFEKYNFEYRKFPFYKLNETIAFLYFLLMVFSVSNVKSEYEIQRSLKEFVRSSRLKQSWGLFSGPRKYDGWVVVEGTLEDGEKVDLLRETKPLSWEKPVLYSAEFENHRQRKYVKNLSTKYPHYRHEYLEWLCRKWNVNHVNNQVVSAKFFYLSESIFPEGIFVPRERKMQYEISEKKHN